MTDANGASRRTLLLLLGGMAGGPVTAGGDQKLLPAEQRQFWSPSARFLLEVTGPAQWATPQAQAALFRAQGTERQRLWSRALPQRFGPGQVLVTDSGLVLMFDEGQKSPSAHAIELWAQDGERIARYAMHEIAHISGVALPDLVSRAKVGPWMSAAPALQPGHEVAWVEAGHVRLALHLATGRLVRAGP